MKKIFYVVPLVVLLAAGCNAGQPAEQTQPIGQTQPQAETVQVKPEPEAYNSELLSYRAEALNSSKTSWKITHRYNNAVIGTQTAQGEGVKVEYLATRPGSVYFKVIPGGMGGYILYSVSLPLYRIDTEAKTVSEYIANTDVSSPYEFSSDGKGAMNVYWISSSNSLKVKDLKTDKVTEWPLPASLRGAQFGTLMLSPENNRLAFVAAFGPDNMRSAIYLVDLANGKVAKHTEAEEKILEVTGWSEAGGVLFKAR